MLAPRPVLLALPLLLAGCLERAQPSVDAKPQPVMALRVAAAPESAPQTHAALVVARREAELAFRAPGRLLVRAVDVGTRVARGQVLARLDPADLALSLRAAEADLAGAEAQSAQAIADAQRSRALLAGGWTPAASDEARQTAARSAAQRVEAARAALELARNRLAYAELRAPADGVVTAVLAERGTVLAEGQAALRLAETEGVEVEAALPETALPGLAQRPAEVTFWAKPGLAVPARLREIAAAATPGLRSYTARYSIEAPEGIAIGMSATLALRTPLPPGLAALPAAALADRGQGPMVWVIDQAAGRVAARPVQVVALGAERALVGGLRSGELVVALGVHRLDPATQVRITAMAGE